MYTVINRIPVPAPDPSAFEEHEFTSSQAFTDWMRSPAFAAAHGSASHSMAGAAESYEAVADVRADGQDA